MITPTFGASYIVDNEFEKDVNWKVGTTVYVIATGLFYILLPTRRFVTFSSSRNLVTLNAPVASGAVTTFADITGLSFPVISGINYRARATLLHSADALTTAVRISQTGPTMTKMAKMVLIPQTKAGSNGNLWIDASDTADDAMIGATSMSTSSNIIVADFIFRPSADGIFQLRFASEFATPSSIIIEAGSTLEWW